MTVSKRMKRFSSVILFGILLLSCTSKDQFQQERVLDSVFSINELSFNPLGESFSFTFSADGNWQISKPQWLTVSPSSGSAGTYEITVAAAINNVWAQGTGAIEVGGHQIQVSQDCPYLRISYPQSQETLEVSEIPVTTADMTVGNVEAIYAWNHSDRAGRAPLQVKVESNVEWEILLDDSCEETYFLVDDHTSGSYSYTSGETIDIHASLNNYQKEDMHTRLTIRPKEVEGQTRAALDEAIATYQLDLNQNHLLFLINGEAEDLEAGFDELGYVLDPDGYMIPDTYVSTFDVECEIPWEVQLVDADGMPVSSSFVEASNYGSQTRLDLRIPGRYNPAEERREVTVRLSADNGEAVRDIVVHQNPYIFEIDGNGTADTSFDNGELHATTGNIHEISIRTSGAWSVSVPSSDPEWLVVDPETAGGKDSPGSPAMTTVRFWADAQNLHLKNAAEAYLRFTAVNGLIKDVPIRQEPFILRADYDAADLTNISATRTSERKTMSVSASNAWTLKDSNNAALVTDSWYALSRTHSDYATSGQIVEVGAAQQNPSETADRQLTVLLTSDIHEAMSTSEKSKWGYEPVKISLRQRPFTFRVNGKAAGEANSMSLPAYMESFTDFLDIDCDADWTIVSAPSWTAPDSYGGSTDRDVLLRPDINLETTSRTGTFEIRCVWGDNVRTINVSVSQEGLVFQVVRTDSQSLTDLDPDINFGSHKPLSYGFQVTATEGLPWRLISSDSNFIAPVQSENGSGAITVNPTYNADLNYGRTAVVEVTLDSNRDGRIGSTYVSRYRNENSWTFTQKKFVFDQGDVSTTAAFRALGALKSGSKDYSFRCSGPWEVIARPQWIHLRSEGTYITEGTSDPSFELVPDENLTQNSRPVSYVTVMSRIGGYTKSIPVSQDAYYYGVTSSASMNFPTVNVTGQTLRFRSSGDWTLDGDGTWGLNRTSGPGDDTGKEISVTVQPPEYTNMNADHTGTLTLRSSHGSTVFSTQQIYLNQPRYVFNTGKSSLEYGSPFRAQCAAESVTVNCSSKWEAKTSADWLTVSRSSGTGDGTFSVSVSKDNLSLSNLTANVTVTTMHAGVKVGEITIPVTQAAYQFSVPSSREISSSAQTVSLSITCSGDWVVTKTKDDGGMISDFTASGKGNGNISVSVNANSGRNAKERTATLQVKCENSDNLVKTITLTQKN